MRDVGPEISRIDARDKVLGAAKYAADHLPEDVVIALALRSPVARGRIVSINDTVARTLPGILGIFTHLNVSELQWRNDPAVEKLSAEGLGRDAMGDRMQDSPFHRPLSGDEIYFGGQWIAIVVAETIEQARAALSVVEVDIAEIEPTEQQPVRPGFFFNADMQYTRERNSRREARNYCVRETYVTPMQLQQPMEPSSTTAVWNNDRVTLYDSTQGVVDARNYVAKSLCVLPDQVTVLSPCVGGGLAPKIRCGHTRHWRRTLQGH